MPIRGNIQTRIDKMKIDGLDGLVVAKAALNRLEILHPNIFLFSEEQMLPAAAQGAIGIEINKNTVSSDVGNLLQLINDKVTHQATEIERLIVASLQGNCLSPISVLCLIKDQQVKLKARVTSQDGNEVINEIAKFKLENKVNAVHDFIEMLISNGAREIIKR